MKAWVFSQQDLERATAGLPPDLRDAVYAALGDRQLMWGANQWTFSDSQLAAMPAEVQAWLRSDAARRLRVSELEG